MTSTTWVPLSQRLGKMPRFEPTTGMPDYLRNAVILWLRTSGTINRSVLVSLSAALRVDATGQIRPYGTACDALVRALGMDDERWLDTLDWLLSNTMTNPARLRELLDAAGHVLTVSPDGTHLIERLEPTAVTTFEMATAPDDTASSLMNEAWTLTFGSNPQPLDGWGKAVKALEAVLAPIVAPTDTKATLGKMTSTLRSKPDAFHCTLPDRSFKTGGHETVKLGIEVLTDMLTTIGYQPGRHGSYNTSEADSRSARSVVLIATSVLASLRDGALTSAE